VVLVKALNVSLLTS